MLRYLLEKEFKQFFRNRFLPRLVIGLPFVALAVFPLVANMDVKNLSLAIVDNDHTATSRQISAKVLSSGYFKTNPDVSRDRLTYETALESIEKGDVDLLLEIPSNFEQNLNREHSGGLMIAANAVNGMQGSLGSTYLWAIIGDYNRELILRQTPDIPTAAVGVHSLFYFNPRLDYKLFMIPAITAMMLAIIAGFLPALNIVAEKENGTMEQMNVTPVGKFTLIISKLIPYWTAGLVDITLCLLTGFIFYGLFPCGSIGLLYLFSGVFILSISGFGLVISNYARNIQQAIFIMFFFVITMIFISGLYTPYQNMPIWAQYLSDLSPLKYFIQVLRMLYLKGTTFTQMQLLFYPLCILAVFFNGWAVASYRKKM